jgi:hypothetical protein
VGAPFIGIKSEGDREGGPTQSSEFELRKVPNKKRERKPEKKEEEKKKGRGGGQIYIRSQRTDTN